MPTNRGVLKLIILSAITFGIYPLFFWSKYASDMNIVCQGDNRHTRGILARIVFSFITFGIYDLFWMYGAGERISYNAQKRGIPCNVSGTGVLLWFILGSFIFVGPFVALHKLLHGLNDLCYAYNEGRR